MSHKVAQHSRAAHPRDWLPFPLTGQLLIGIQKSVGIPALHSPSAIERVRSLRGASEPSSLNRPLFPLRTALGRRFPQVRAWGSPR